MADPPVYELYAIKYATREARRSDHFIGGDPHDGPMPMDYFVWVAVSPEQSIVIDIGFTAEVAAKRGLSILRCPIDPPRLVGVAPDTVKYVVLTHMHYDHVGNFHKFPIAEFHLQEPEMQFATGRYMRYDKLATAFEVEDVVGMVRLNFGKRVRFYTGDAELAPGITLHAAYGHSAGLQFVRVHTRRGWVVVASDVSHYYENMESGRPFTVAFHVGGML
ncbi:MAG: N-acyl homoserine lactonase family protein, partial [Alphaproteobacteria bacterium]|nr:N-acyl homoserine lactonase family protein [Alphaproteobacteria bacterium]